MNNENNIAPINEDLNVIKYEPENIKSDLKFKTKLYAVTNWHRIKTKFDGQVYDAFSLIIDLIKKAKNEIILIDNYVDIDTLNILAKKNNNVNVEIYTKSNTKLTAKDINNFNIQYSNAKMVKKL